MEPDTTSADGLVADTARLGRKCKVGHFSKIGNNCGIGDNVIIS